MLLAPLLAGPEIVVAVLLEDGVLPVVGLGVAIGAFREVASLGRPPVTPRCSLSCCLARRLLARSGVGFGATKYFLRYCG